MTGWHLLRDQNRIALCDQDGALCFEEVDEDQLAIRTRLVHRQVPVTAAQMDSVIEQNQQLWRELDQLLLMHQTDAEHMQEMTMQR